MGSRGAGWQGCPGAQVSQGALPPPLVQQAPGAPASREVTPRGFGVPEDERVWPPCTHPSSPARPALFLSL